MTVRPVCLDAGDAVELGELLEFLVGWIDHADDRLAASFDVLVGGGGYNIEGLRADLVGFAFLLGSDGELLFGGDQR